MRSRNIDAHSAARIRLIIREAVRARMGLLNEADGDALAASWASDGSLTVTTGFVASRIAISRFVGGNEGNQIQEWKNEGGIPADSYTLLVASAAEVQSKDTEGILVRATPKADDAEPKAVTIMFSARKVSAAATDAKAAEKATKAADGIASDDGDKPNEPHAAAGDVQDLARRGLRAVKKGFADEEAGNTVKITDLSAPPAGHKWITHDDRGELGDWQKDDAYTYIALVPVGGDPKPVLFVVSGDPEDNSHHSTGYILAPDSRQPLHRKAFCTLYKRATGKTHPSCVPGGGGSSRRAGSGDGSGDGSGTKYTGASSDIDTGGRSVSVTLDGDRVRRGRGDAESVAGLNRMRERVFGRRFYSRSDEGFDRMGPGGAATPAVLRRGKQEGGAVPKTIVVVFKNPILIDPRAIAVSRDGSQHASLANASFGSNSDVSDIVSIGFYYKKAADNLRSLFSIGVPRSPGRSFGGKFTQKDDPDAFRAAADWIFANPQQFDLAEDIEFHGEDRTRKEGEGVSDTKQKAGGGAELGTGGASADDVAALTEKKFKREGLSESRRTPLLDRYRF